MDLRQGLPTRLAGGALGLTLLLGWLALWRLASDAAGLFAPMLAAGGVAALVIAHQRRARAYPFVAAGLRTAGIGAIVLAVGAALSLGALLPPGVAAWASPTLGRFGGPVALGGLALALLAVARRCRSERRRGIALDAAMLLSVAAAWIWVQTTRQVSFPTPPTTAAIIDPRLRALCGLGLALGLLAARTTRATPWHPLAACCWRWGGAATLLGLAVGFATGSGVRWWLALPLALWLTVGVVRWRSSARATPIRAFGRGVGWLALIALTLTLVYAATSEDLEPVFLRNTAEYRALAFWRGALGTARDAVSATGQFGGTVRDSGGTPLGGVSVVVADATGRPFSAVSGPDGRYLLTGVPAGNYLPLAVGPAHLHGARTGLGGRVATVRAGRAASGVDFRLRPRPAYDPSINDSLRLEPQTQVTVEGLQASTVLRRSFAFANRGKTLDGGLIHEPRPERGAGPFPILLIIYPGEAASWEGVSTALAARDHVVISYFPRRLLDLAGDMDDLRLLLNLAGAGQLSARGDTARIALAGGSVSTVYTYLLARDAIASSGPGRPRAAIQYGGLFDLYAFRRSWEEGRVIIDPGISELEYLLVALGRPDNRPEFYLRLSPRYGLGPGGLPPTLLVHAARDIIVPPDQSRLADAGLAGAAIPRQLLLYPDLEHYLDLSKQAPEQLDMLEQTIAFLQTWAR